MTFSIKNDLLYKDGSQVDHYKTKKTSGKMKSNPRFIVIHYTAGLSFEGDIRTLSSSETQASCQLVLSVDGKYAQIGDFKDVLWHAGKSTWKGISGLNSYSIGIEVTNPGWVDFAYEKDGINYYKFPVNGKVYWNDRDHTIVKARHKNGGPVKYWVEFSKAQLNALSELIPVLMKHYGIQEVVGHDMIAPDRKIDPGPCLPDGFYEVFNGNPNVMVFDTLATVNAPSGLNVRSGPGANFTKIGSLRHGETVDLNETKNGWSDVTSANLRGWVSNQYLK